MTDRKIIATARLSSAHWHAAPSEDLQKFWDDLLVRLVQDGKRVQDAKHALSALAHLTKEYNLLSANEQAPIDPRRLDSSDAGRQRLRDAWERLQQRCGWSPKHMANLRAHLAHAVAQVNVDLVATVNPLHRQRKMMFRCSRSHEQTFSLHRCIPQRIRGYPEAHDDYQFFVALLENLSNHLRSVSREALLKTAAWLDRLFFGGDAADAWFPIDMPTDPAARCGFLRRQTARDWITRYSCVTADRSIGFDLMKRQFRTMNIVHAKILHPADAKLLAIPMPRLSGRIGGRDTEELSTASSNLSSNSELGEGARKEVSRLHEIIGHIRERVCRSFGEQRDDLPALSDAEVHRILDAARSALERLVVVLFLHTGLRLGGVARLRPCRDTITSKYTSGVTTEKNGKSRTIRLSPALHVLICRWLAERQVDEPRFLFPSTRNPAKPVHKCFIWKVCQGVFAKAEVTGRNAHPHAFRHTVVRMLYLRGKTFDQIAKWIGHASSSITERVYGRLSTEEIDRMMDDDAEEKRSLDRDRWMAVAKRIKNPYPWDGVGEAVDAATSSAMVPCKPMDSKHTKRRKTDDNEKQRIGELNDIRSRMERMEELLCVNGR